MRHFTEHVGNGINAAMFYVAWYALVGGAAMDRVVYGVLLTFGILAAHFYMIKRRAHEALLACIIVSVGFIIDTALIQYGVLEFASPSRINPGIPPLWILCLYAVFATSINHSFIYIGRYPILVAGFGAIGAPVCYYLGAQLGAAKLLLPNHLSLVVVGVVWLFYLPLMFKINKWIQ